MNLAARLIPPSLDVKQALRLRRFGLAALVYVLSTGLVAVAWTFGVLPGSDTLQIAATFLAVNLGLYAAIRSGYNLRFADPSLTRFHSGRHHRADAHRLPAGPGDQSCQAQLPPVRAALPRP
jgi:hypothetical protein